MNCTNNSFDSFVLNINQVFLFSLSAFTPLSFEGGKKEVWERNGEVLQLSGKASEYVGKEERAPASRGIYPCLNYPTHTVYVTCRKAIHYDGKRDKTVLCLVWKSLFLISASGAMGEVPRCKAFWTMWVSTDMPCSNSFPGLYQKEMCAHFRCTAKVKLDCCSLGNNPCYSTMTWTFYMWRI